MFHLAEGMVRDTPAHSDKLLTDLGATLPSQHSVNIPKKAAHEKYYWC